LPLLLGLAAGASVQGVYWALKRLIVTEQLDLSRSRAYTLDEYYPMQPSDPRSFVVQVSNIAARLGLRREALHALSGDLPRERVEGHCRQYEQSIRAAGGIDLQLLGVGRSGHIGFNEPGASRGSRTRIVQLDDRTRQDAAHAFRDLGQVPKEAITRGVAPILEAKEIALIALGEPKAAIIRAAVADPVSAGVPASFLRGHPCATVYLDDLAARGLDRSMRQRMVS
jgi:glucosamine-6-phosphate deaminase